jgi:hypothetical protein
MSLDKKMLKLYAQNNFNVLISGRHGTGKTETIKEIFNEEFGDNWAYFSASTMDAWVDFIGVPKAVTRDDGTQVLELIKPARFADDTVEALVFDEYNRSPMKVRNAVMELIQFKSINGRKFKNLKVIWAAINPFTEEGTYDVDEIDPAQLDRFPIKIQMPYKLDKKYFKNKHGAQSKAFIDWWTSLSEDNQFKVSPRLLDESIKVYNVGGDLKHVLPLECNISDLIKRIRAISADDEWKHFTTGTKNDKLSFLSNLSNVSKFKSYILNDISKYIEYVPEDYILTQIDTKDEDWINSFLLNENDVPEQIKKEVEDIYEKSFSDSLKELLGILPNYKSIDLNGSNVVISGKFLLSYNGGNTQSDIKQLLGRIGANLQKSVIRSTDYLISTDNNATTTKVIDANNLGTNIITESEFHKIYGSY